MMMNDTRPINVAVYCRVSTVSENEAASFSHQKKYYEEYVNAHSNWRLVRIYSDEGLSVTSVAKRDGFIQMLKDCEEGKIDFIIVKSISRISRNVVECIEIARALLNAKHRVGIYFQEQNINTLTNYNEIKLTMLSSIAQAESQAKTGGWFDE